jgi:hypothetical protein
MEPETMEKIPDNWPIAPYVPPLERTAFEELVRVARLYDEKAEAAEVTFGSGKRAFVIYSEMLEESYVLMDPGEYLVFGPDLKLLGVAEEEEVRNE